MSQYCDASAAKLEYADYGRGYAKMLANVMFPFLKSYWNDQPLQWKRIGWLTNRGVSLSIARFRLPAFGVSPGEPEPHP